jgi:hypothetical protein
MSMEASFVLWSKEPAHSMASAEPETDCLRLTRVNTFHVDTSSHSGSSLHEAPTRIGVARRSAAHTTFANDQNRGFLFMPSNDLPISGLRATRRLREAGSHTRR